jgi:hypothetical protein
MSYVVHHGTGEAVEVSEGSGLMFREAATAALGVGNDPGMWVALTGVDGKVRQVLIAGGGLIWIEKVEDSEAEMNSFPETSGNQLAAFPK